MALPELSEEMEARAARLHREAFVFDACIPTTGFFRDEEGEIQAFMEGGMSGANLTFASHKHNFLKTIDSIIRHCKVIDRHPDKLRLCTTVADLQECKQEGKVGVVMHFQDSKPIEEELDYLGIFYRLGLRVLQLTYNMQGAAGNGICERYDSGLTSFGLDLVAECNRQHILVDLSHCSHKTAWDAVEHSKAPVAFTHAGVYAVCPAFGRNKPDDLMKAVVGTGGVFGVSWQPMMLKRNPATHEVLPSSVNDVLEQIDHAVKLLGADKVGLGSDLSDYSARTLECPSDSSYRWHRPLRPDVFGVGPTDRYDPFPEGLDSHSKMLNLTRGLVQRGYSDEEIKGILGGNWLRLYEQVWQG